MPSELFCLFLWTNSLPIKEVCGWLLPCFIEIHAFNANIDSDQTGILWRLIWVYTVLPMPLLWDAKHKWIKLYFMAVEVESFFNRKLNFVMDGMMMVHASN